MASGAELPAAGWHVGEDKACAQVTGQGRQRTPIAGIGGKPTRVASKAYKLGRTPCNAEDAPYAPRAARASR